MDGNIEIDGVTYTPMSIWDIEKRLDYRKKIMDYVREHGLTYGELRLAMREPEYVVLRFVSDQDVGRLSIRHLHAAYENLKTIVQEKAEKPVVSPEPTPIQVFDPNAQVY